jgi:hypothetical protein
MFVFEKKICETDQLNNFILTSGDSCSIPVLFGFSGVPFAEFGV